MGYCTLSLYLVLVASLKGVTPVVLRVSLVDENRMRHEGQCFVFSYSTLTLMVVITI